MKKKLILVATALLAVAPLFAVLNERNLAETLSVLRYELRSAYKSMEARSKRLRGNGDRQHARLVQMMQRSNELSLMLYSQKQDYTFDMTYALNEVSKNYNEFASRKLPFDDIITRLDIDIDRYDRLVHALRSLPPSTAVEYVDSLGNVVTLQTGGAVPPPEFRPRRMLGEDREPVRTFELDSAGRIDRDSCLFYAENLLAASRAQKEKLVSDSTHYAETALMLKSAYDYAQERYKTVQNKIFVDGQTPYHQIIKGFRWYWVQARRDAVDKYGLSEMAEVRSQWRGPMVIGFTFFALSYLLLSLLVSVVLVSVLTRKVKFFRRRTFTAHRKSMVTIVTMIIFSLTILLASAFSTQNFFSMASRLLVEFAWMLAAILISLVIRLEEDAVGKGLRFYLPVIVMCLVIIGLRIIFIPNSLLNIILPPFMLIFTVWQGIVLFKYKKKVPHWDVMFGWVSFAMVILTTLVAFRGYVLLGVQLLIWWIFLLTLLQTVITVYDLLKMYYERHIVEMKARYIKEHPDLPHKTDEDLIQVTWLYRLIKSALLPIAFILSVPMSLKMASGVFDLTDIYKEYYAYPFLNVEGYISLSFSKIVLVFVLYFVFRYLSHLARAYYRLYRIKMLLKESGGKMIRENQYNFTLAENVIGITLWGIYVITLFVLLKIPTAAVKVVAAGLATGMGFAMKDILNNFFYGVQLMSGRLRVGDSIECDGIRGKVESINYQTTQIVSTDGALMAFPNATLFNKNFKNLTRNNSYEMVTFDVGVKYGVNVEEVREIILEALKPLQVRDKYGREVVDSKRGVQVRFKDFGDNSVNLTVVQYTTVEEHFTYAAKAKELVYNALNEHGIEIPFPQRDLYIKAMPSDQ